MTETEEQQLFTKWFVERWPEHAKSLRVSMNGLKFRSRRTGSMMWNFMKSVGVQPDEPDIVLLIPKGGHPYFVSEHKAAGQPHKLTEGQQEHLDYHQGLGAVAVSTRGLEMLKTAVTVYMEN